MKNIIKFLNNEGTTLNGKKILFDDDLNDFEKVEVIYDMSSTDPNINLVYTSGIVPSGENVQGFKALRSAKKLRFYYRYNEWMSMSEVDMRNPYKASRQGICLPILPTSTTNNEVLNGLVFIVDNSSISFNVISSNSSGTSMSNNQNFRITKIEKIN